MDISLYIKNPKLPLSQLPILRKKDIVRSPIKDIDGNVYPTIIIDKQEWITINLKVIRYSDGTPIPNIASDYGDWFLPSKYELKTMYDNLYLYGIGDFVPNGGSKIYFSSTEVMATTAFAFSFGYDTNWESGAAYWKNISGQAIRPMRKFTSTEIYNIRQRGPAGGWICYIENIGGGNYTYYEAGPEDLVNSGWSNITSTAIGETAQGTAIGTGEDNTIAIIGQEGHVYSAAKLCVDLVGDLTWQEDIEGAYCWYNNNSLNKNPFGALYNKKTLENASGLVRFTRDGILEPDWKIPSIADFLKFLTFLNDDSTAAGRLKETGLINWNTPNTGANDELSFAAVGAGYRNESGAFSQLKNVNRLWASDGLDEFGNYIHYLELLYNSNETSIVDDSDITHEKFGLSVRCVRDLT